MFSVLVIRLRSLRLLRVSGIVMRLLIFFNDTATTEIYTLSLHDALPIYRCGAQRACGGGRWERLGIDPERLLERSEEHTSELQSPCNLVCRLLLEKKKDDDPDLHSNLPPREISMKDVFRSGDSSKKFKIAEGQWYRYAPSYFF